jgi:hypothetical protein
MIVYKLTVAQKNKLIGVEYIADCIYNPLEDANGNWIISEGEVEQTIDENFLWVKDLPQIDYKPILEEDAS